MLALLALVALFASLVVACGGAPPDGPVTQDPAPVSYRTVPSVDAGPPAPTPTTTVPTPAPSPAPVEDAGAPTPTPVPPAPAEDAGASTPPCDTFGPIEPTGTGTGFQSAPGARCDPACGAGGMYGYTATQPDQGLALGACRRDLSAGPNVYCCPVPACAPASTVFCMDPNYSHSYTCEGGFMPGAGCLQYSTGGVTHVCCP
jgi:hypothetical protein